MLSMSSPVLLCDRQGLRFVVQTLHNIQCLSTFQAGAAAARPQARTLLGLSDAMLNLGSAKEMGQQCPAWMAEYSAFHNATRYSPSAKFLIYQCSHGREDERHGSHGSMGQFCNGLGDRLQGMMFMTRLAYATSRVLLINNTRPAQLSEGFVPTSFDWRVGNLSTPCSNPYFPIQEACTGKDSNGRSVSASYWTSHGGWGDLPAWLNNGSIRNDTTTHMYMTAVHPPYTILPDWAPPLSNDPIQGSHLHCLFNLMFKPSERVNALVLSLQGTVSGGTKSPPLTSLSLVGVPYMAMHLRFSIDGKYLSKVELEDSFICARAMASLHNLSLIYVATDESKIRSEIVRGEHPGFVTTNLRPMNIDLMEHSGSLHDEEEFVETIAEMVMLARAKCLVLSMNSGFGRVAQMLGGQDCWTSVQHCAHVISRV